MLKNTTKHLQKIAITGGKGGTGKSTFAILLAKKLISEGKKVLIADLDVDCPNDHLLLQVQLNKAVEEVFNIFPKIDPKKCTLCGACVNVCKKNALFQVPGKAPTLIDANCLSCFLCKEVCPADAISERKEKVGEVFINTVEKKLVLISGQSKVGLKESVIVVNKTKKIAEKYAEENDIDVILFDLPAGIHCNVIAGLLNTDFAYAVTEPTPLGANDLALIIEVLKTLDIDKKIVLNKADLGDKNLIISQLKKLSNEKELLKIDIEIPYLEEIEREYVKGNLSKLTVTL